MIKYIIKRLLQLIPILVGITFLSFAMMRLAGGDAVTYMYDNAGAAVPKELIEQTKARQEKNMVSTSRFLFSMQSGLREWQLEIWERVTYPGGMSMKLS